MDLASVFYTLGIVFIVSCMLLFVGIGIFIWRLYTSLSNLKKEAPMKVVGFLQSQNSAGLRAVGVAIIGFILAGIKNRFGGKKS